MQNNFVIVVLDKQKTDLEWKDFLFQKSELWEMKMAGQWRLLAWEKAKKYPPKFEETLVKGQSL